MSGFSLKFTKTTEKKVLKDSKLRDEATKDVKEDLDYVKDILGKKIIGTKKEEEKKPLVIPLISANKWREGDKRLADIAKQVEGDDDDQDKDKVKSKTKKSDLELKDEKDLTVEEKAARELLKESRKEMEDWSDRHNGVKVSEIPLLMRNAPPAEYENDDNLDVSLRAEQSTLEDYESVPVEQFGMAVLRGMGWKPNVGIGGFKSQVVKTIDPVVRPKGLGLGASKPKTNDTNSQTQTKEGEEKLTMKRGAFIRVESGRKAGLYGEVEGLDEENGRVNVKMALGGESLTISENIVKLVTQKEYKEWGKIVNKDKYEKFKKEKDEKNGKHRSRSRSRSRSKERYREKDSYRSADSDKYEKKKKEKKYKRDTESEDSDSDHGSDNKRKERTWVRPDLRVRCIDKRYKDGKYFNAKVTVVDVVTNDRCDCRTDEGRLLEGLRTDKLETVIPREDRGRVMIVGGSSRGEVAEIMDKNKQKCKATVRLLLSGDLLEKYYEDICSYVGQED